MSASLRTSGETEVTGLGVGWRLVGLGQVMAEVVMWDTRPLPTKQDMADPQRLTPGQCSALQPPPGSDSLLPSQGIQSFLSPLSGDKCGGTPTDLRNNPPPFLNKVGAQLPLLPAPAHPRLPKRRQRERLFSPASLPTQALPLIPPSCLESHELKGWSRQGLGMLEPTAPHLGLLNWG